MTEFNRSDYMTTGEAARYLAVSTESVRRWADDGRLTGVRTASGHRLVLRESVEAMLPRPIAGES